MVLTMNKGTLWCSRKRFGSDMSIVAGVGVVTQAGGGDLLQSRLSTHRSDHEIHTPEHRSNVRLEQVMFSSSQSSY